MNGSASSRTSSVPGVASVCKNRPPGRSGGASSSTGMCAKAAANEATTDPGRWLATCAAAALAPTPATVPETSGRIAAASSAEPRRTMVSEALIPAGRAADAAASAVTGASLNSRSDPARR